MVAFIHIFRMSVNVYYENSHSFGVQKRTKRKLTENVNRSLTNWELLGATKKKKVESKPFTLICVPLRNRKPAKFTENIYSNVGIQVKNGKMRTTAFILIMLSKFHPKCNARMPYVLWV